MLVCSWPTTAAHRLELKCAASDVHGKGHALRPPFRDWGLSTRFAALHRDPTVALRPQCLRSAESGATACAARAADAGAERSDGPKGCPAPLPLWPCRGAQLQADQGRALFEPPGEFARTPPEARTAGCPVAQRRGHGQRGRLLFGDFLSAGDRWRRKRKLLRRRAHIPAPELGKGMQPEKRRRRP